jgi:hypothetical protein
MREHARLRRIVLVLRANHLRAGRSDLRLDSDRLPDHHRLRELREQRDLHGRCMRPYGQMQDGAVRLRTEWGHLDQPRVRVSV